MADFAAKPEAIVLTNPPYGERMSTIEGAAKLARTLGRQMEASPCAGLYAITADMDFEPTTASAPTSAARCTTA